MKQTTRDIMFMIMGAVIALYAGWLILNATYASAQQNVSQSQYYSIFGEGLPTMYQVKSYELTHNGNCVTFWNGAYTICGTFIIKDNRVTNYAK